MSLKEFSGCIVLGVYALGFMVSVQAHNESALGLVDVDWKDHSSIIRVLSSNFNFHGGQFTISYRNNGVVEERQGKRCLKGAHFSFDIDDNYAFNIDETVTIDILMADNGASGFTYSYDHAINPVRKTVTFEGKSEQGWHSHRVTFDRARFSNRLYHKTDFSLSAVNAVFPQTDFENDQQIVICDIQVERQNKVIKYKTPGKLKLGVKNEKGQATSVRAGLYAADGKAPLSSDEALTIMRFGERLRDIPLLQVPEAWPSDGRYVFYVDGDYSADLQPGKYTLVLAKGPEYRMITKEIQIRSGKTTELGISLERWRDLPAQGWYSGDDHIHITRKNPSVNDMVSAYVQAEDVHLTNLLQMANLTNYHFKQYRFGKAGHYIEDDYALLAGQESPRTTHRGHTIGLNGKQFYYPTHEYHLYDKTAKAVKADGGMFGYAHVGLDGFNVAWGLALDAPFGYVDFLEVLQFGVLGTNYLYDLLNMGFKILPSAGSDYPYLFIAGTERIYAKLDKPFTVRNWFDAWQHNRSLISNGPMIEFTVNSDASSQEFDVTAGSKITVKAEASLNPDYDQIDRIELVRHGKVIASASAKAASSSVELEFSYDATASHWLALRAYGKISGKAHTAPVYIYVDGNQHFYDKEQLALLANKYIAYLDEMAGSTPDVNKEWEQFDVEGQVLPQWEKDKPELNKRIQLARELYQNLIREARGEIRHLSIKK